MLFMQMGDNSILEFIFGQQNNDLRNSFLHTVPHTLQSYLPSINTDLFLHNLNQPSQAFICGQRFD